MAKLFVVQDRYDEEITTWHIFSNATKAQKKFDELEAEYKTEYEDEYDYEDWRVELNQVSGPHCGFLIGFDNWEGKVFADPVKDVRGYELDDFIYRQTTAYLIGPKTKEGKIVVGSYGELDFPSGNVQQLAYWEESELEDDNIPESNQTTNQLKYVQLFEDFVNTLNEEEEYALYEKKYSSAERKELEKKGQAMPGGRFPIVDLADLRNAIFYIGKGVVKAPEEAAKFIAKRMKELEGLKYEDMFNKALARAGVGKAKDFLALA